MDRPLVVLASGIALLAPASCGNDETPPAEMAALMESLNLDPPVELDVDCPAIPAGAQRVLFSGVFTNQPPIRPPDPNFPADYCPENTQFYARADGQGNSTVFGEFTWWERYCTLPGFQLSADGYFEATNGDRLTWDALIRADSVPPPIPYATFVGEFTFTGGTGPFAAIQGRANVAAKQLGDAPVGLPAGSTAAAICGWIDTPAG